MKQKYAEKLSVNQLNSFEIDIYLQPKNLDKMQADKHPKEYRLVVFQDMTNGESFLTRSCVNTSDTTTWEDGNEYPIYKLEISNTSHPFFTGKKMLVDTAGRIEKFNRKFRKVKK